jgi:hypothetical protein
MYATVALLGLFCVQWAHTRRSASVKGDLAHEVAAEDICLGRQMG